MSAPGLVSNRNAPSCRAKPDSNKPGIFKIAFFKRWAVIASGPELIEDVRKAPDDILSIDEPLRELIQSDYTLRFLDTNSIYHRGVVRSKLTRDIAATFDQVQDELPGALRDCIPDVGEEWVKVSIIPTVQRLICRLSSRVFVGAPLCRDHDYQRLASSTTMNIVYSGIIISMFPKLFKPIVARIFYKHSSQVQQTMEFIRPVVEERFAKMEEFGENWDDAPNDTLMMLMKEAKGVERSLEGLARRLVAVNFASIFTTSLTSVYRLLGHPEYIEPLREEAEAAVAEAGWTKAGMDKMHKIDSFIRETHRLVILASWGNSSRTTSIHIFKRDEEIYPNPHEFDGFRFSKLREKEGDAAAARYQTVAASAEYLAFGLGRHTCPGRFLAVNEIKALLAHILVTYDVKFEEGTVPSRLSSSSLFWRRNEYVLFRQRQQK
ncbi:cytochrome P450 [Russula brevipes]|nr:cytochrome P450 [Russula brevipes]